MSTAAPPDYKEMALECLEALRLMSGMFDDMCKSNPGFMGKLCIQRIDVVNTALIKSDTVLKKYGHVETASGLLG